MIQKLLPASVVDRRFQMAVGDYATMAGKMFACGGHTSFMHTSDKRSSHFGNRIGLVRKCAVTNDTASLPIDI